MSGAVLAVAAKPLASLLGLAIPAILIGVGVSRVAAAAGLFRNAARQPIGQTEELPAVIRDAAWVAGSAVLVLVV